MLHFIPLVSQKNVTLTISHFIFLLVLLAFLINYDLHAAEQNKINIDITTHLGDATYFQEGDRVSFLISLDKDAYVLVVYQNAKGEIFQLLPNKRFKNNFYKAGLFLALPTPETTFAFKIQAPFGRETLWAFTADVPLPELKGQYRKDGLKKLSERMGIIQNILARQPKSAYGKASLVLYTRARNSSLDEQP